MRPSVEQFAEAKPLRVTANHESLADFDSGTGAHGEQSLRFSDSEAERFFAEYMLTGLGGLDGPRDMQLIGKRNVNCVDIWICEQFLIRAVGRGNS